MTPRISWRRSSRTWTSTATGGCASRSTRRCARKSRARYGAAPSPSARARATRRRCLPSTSATRHSSARSRGTVARASRARIATRNINTPRWTNGDFFDSWWTRSSPAKARACPRRTRAFGSRDDARNASISEDSSTRSPARRVTRESPWRRRRRESDRSPTPTSFTSRDPAASRRSWRPSRVRRRRDPPTRE